jgi:hypothetical protein
MFSAFIFFDGSELHDVKKKAIAKATKKEVTDNLMLFFVIFII